MLRNYLIVAIRTLTRNRAHAAINIGGLALGLAGCLLILTYIRHESSFDNWLPDSERIYQVQSTSHEPGQPVTRSQDSPNPVREALPQGFSEIEAITALRAGQTVTTREGQPIFIDVQTVDGSFFRVLDLPFLRGSAAQALPNINSVVLTRSEAIQQFGSDDVLGRTMSLGTGPDKRDYAVSGVLKDLPSNSSLQLSLLFREDPTQRDPRMGWSWLTRQHYVKLRPGADAKGINAAMHDWEKRVIPSQASGKISPADTLDLKLVPIGAVHLGEAQLGALTPPGDTGMLKTFAVVALLTLGMAVMNFVNLTTARATQRAREVALRKTMGATRAQIIVQFLGESLLSAGIAMLLALTLAELVLPAISQGIHADLRITYLGRDGMLLPTVLLFVVTGVLGGLYPAFYLSRFRPAVVLRSSKSQVDTPGGGRLRTFLVVVQFAIAIGLIGCTTVIYSQTRFAETVDPGYRRDGLIQVDAAWNFAGDDHEYQAAHREMLAVAGVAGAGRTNLGLVATRENDVAVQAPGGSSGLSLGMYSIDPDYFHTMDMHLVSGRWLGTAQAKDRLVSTDASSQAEPSAPVARGVNVVINRKAAGLLGFATPDAAVGKTIRVGTGDDALAATIVGVVGDTRVRTARDAIEPVIYFYDPDHTSQVIVRYAGARPGEVMAGLTRVWRKFEPEIPFQARFAEEVVGEAYVADQARAVLFAIFSGLGVLISCLGLYSLAAFATERRTKEIGIRKVLGATARDILRLLAWQFSKPVVLANLIAWPVGWWAMRDWLNQFDLRIPLTITPFALAGLLALAIALITVAGHALRAARLRPIHALRYE
jgi:putative ABC transport system permease protein